MLPSSRPGSFRLLSILVLLRLFSLVCCNDGFKLPVFHVPRTRPPSPHAFGYVLNSEVSLLNSQEYAYITKITIGAQDFPVLLDTGSSDLWVVSRSCHDANCQGISKYQTTNTLSLSNSSFNLDYLIGSVSGTIGYETVAIGNYEICSQTFAVANQATGLSLASNGYSGILGLAFPAAASISTTSGINLLENIFSSFQNDSNKFYAYKLGRDQNSLNPEDSSFTIGQLDPSAANSSTLTPDPVFDLIPVVPRYDGKYDYWKIPFISITIDSLTLPLSPSHIPGSPNPIAVLDTGTTLVLGPSRDVQDFWESVGSGSTRKNVWGQWEVKCERVLRVGFVLGPGQGKEYVVDPQDINWAGGSESDGWCLGGVQANNGVNSADWILGDVFLRNVYAKHHFATSSEQPLIGLLSTTDPDVALSRFERQRGHDSAPPVQIRLSKDIHATHKFTPIVLCTAAWLIGFLGGSFGLILLRKLRTCITIRMKK